LVQQARKPSVGKLDYSSDRAFAGACGAPAIPGEQVWCVHPVGELCCESCAGKPLAGRFIAVAVAMPPRAVTFAARQT